MTNDDGLSAFFKWEREMERQMEEEEAAKAKAKQQAASSSLQEGAAPSKAEPPVFVTREQLEEIQMECMADDIPIDWETMSRWTAEMARAFFESGGESLPERPPGTAQ